MPVTKVNAENYDFEVNTGTIASPTWTNISGIEDFDLGDSTTRADTTDIDSSGVEENRVIRRGHSITLNGHWLEDESDGSRDAGQEALETAARAVGSAAEVGVRVTTPGGTTEISQFTVEHSRSGDKNDVTKFSFTLTRTGATTIA